MASSIIPLNGKVVAVGPDENAPDHTTYSYITIEQQDGTARHFAMVRAIYEVAGLIERDVAGTFVFLESPGECRLSYVYCDSGARAADLEALHAYYEAAADTAAA
jgi:hypothetical protein